MSKSGNRSEVVILGAGLAGLSAARHLRRGYRLLEAEDRVGGHCVTEEERGFRFDRTGHLLHLRDPGIRRWIEAALGGRLLSIDRRSWIFSQGVHTRYPFQANTLGLPPAAAYECLLGFVRAWERRERGPEPRDFEQYIHRYFGDGIAKHFMIPYNTKLWGVPPRVMSTAWTQRFVPRPTLEDVIAGATGHEARNLGYNASFLYPRGGIGELPAAIHGALRTPAECGVRVLAIEPRERVVHTASGSVRYERLISTLPLVRLCGLLAGAPAAVRRAAGRLRWVGLRYLDVALERPAGNDHHWTYVPEERFPFYRVGAYSNFSPALAPRGKGSLYVELASRGPWRASAWPGVARGLRELGLIRGAADVRFVRPRWLPFAYVVYDRAWEGSRRALFGYLEEQGILSCGRYGAWEYSAMEDALLAGRAAAERVRAGS